MNKTIKAAIVALVITALTFAVFPQPASAQPVSVSTPDGFSAAAYTYNSIKIKWKKVSDAAGYKLYRAAKKSGSYQCIKTLSSSQSSYTDKKRKTGRAYYYKLRAYKKVSGRTYYSGFTKVKGAKAAVGRPVSFKAVSTSVSDRAKLSWKKVPSITSYKIYRAPSKNGKYKLIKTVSKSKSAYYDSSRKKGATYYYKMKAVKKAGRKTYNSGYTAKKPVCVKKKIMGKSAVSAKELAAFFRKHAKYPSYYAKNSKDRSANTLDKFCQIYVSECQAEGVRAEVAFCQAMLETGWLTFRGDVKISQFNFAGLGATGGGKRGSSFSSVRKGIRAQVQHLKAYGSKAALKNKCVDPRFKYVKRNSSVYVEWLGIKENPRGDGWAASRNYGYKITGLARQI